MTVWSEETGFEEPISLDQGALIQLSNTHTFINPDAAELCGKMQLHQGHRAPSPFP